MKKIFQTASLILLPLFISGNAFASIPWYPTAVTLTAPGGSGCVGTSVNFNFSYTNCTPGGSGANSAVATTVTLFKSPFNLTSGGTSVGSVASSTGGGLGPVTGTIPYTPTV